MADVIVALATPMGRSGIGVIRISGDASLEVLRSLAGRGYSHIEPRRATVMSLIDPLNGETIDEAVVTFFKSPNSFTGEDVVEISCHGSPVLLRQVIDLCLAANARMAEPGEFTLRALGNGKLDLTEAEAIRDLIDARSIYGARQAVRQLRGELSRQIQPLKDDLLNVIVYLESALEFVEDDLPDLERERILASLDDIGERTRRLAETFSTGHLLREGVRVAIAGKPNVGKSSLFNALIGLERAIVTDIAGTTRDHLNENVIIDEMPITLIDTAGIRETVDTVESIGVERAKAVVADADVVIVLLDASVDLDHEDRQILDETADTRRLVVANKSDKSDPDVLSAIRNTIAGNETLIEVSAKFADGIDDLRDKIVEPFRNEAIETSDLLITDARHHDLLNRTADEVDEALSHIRSGLSEEIPLASLHNAIRFLGEITGETTTEDMLTRIFSTFCIGK